jgi:thiol-disulfide isomerase/thioredoxin
MINPNKSKFLSCLAILSCSLLLSSCSKVDYTDNQGNSGSFSDFQGQWMVINYWATWCKPCIEEMPELNHFSTSQAGKAVVFGVDFDQNTGEKLKQAVTKLNIAFPVLINDPAQLLNYPKPQVLPTTLIFNPEGNLVKTLTGPQTLQTLLSATTLK